MRVKEICPRIDRFRSFQGDEFAKLQVEATLGGNGKVKVEICFDHVRLDDRGSRRVVEQTKRMNDARVASVNELHLEAPIELAGLRRHGALEVNYELIQQRVVRAVVKKSAKVLVITWTVRIECNPAVDPSGNREARCRRRRSRLDFAGYGRRGETKSKRANEKLSHGLTRTIGAVRPVLSLGAGR